jgi:hypothetical protein
LRADESFAEEPYHSDLAIGYHIEVATDTIVGCVGLEDRCCGVLQEVEFLAVGDSLLAILKGSGALCRPDELAGPMIFTLRYHVSQRFCHLGHVRRMISEVVHEAEELEHLLLSGRLRKVQNLQALLWSERGPSRGDEVTDVFDLLETQFGFPGVDSDLLRAQALEHSPCVGEEVGVGLAVYEYIVDVDFANFVDKSLEDLVLHTALKVRASSFQSHSNPCPLV